MFADPFNVELQLNDFKELLKSFPKYWDVLVFINIGHIQHFANRSESDRERIAKSLGITVERLKEIFHKASAEKTPFDYVTTEVLSIVREKLMDIKGEDTYIVSVALPLSTTHNVKKRDYYGLVLASGAPSVIERFLKDYIEVLKKYTRFTNLPLFPRLKEEIMKILKKANSLNLKELNNILFTTSFAWFSWKEIVTHGFIEEYPTLKKVIEAINKLYEQSILEIEAPEPLRYKRKPRSLKVSEITKRKKNLEDVIISLKR